MKISGLSSPQANTPTSDFEDIDISFFELSDNSFFITCDRIRSALLCADGNTFLSRVIQESSDKEIARVAKEASKIHQWKVVEFLAANRLSAIISSSKCDKIITRALNDHESVLASILQSNGS
ncbi:MAG: hypothetical protein Q8L98_01005 [Chlamydiales bacterium]|nr:hypothetical protein [Chlamydiales bacterium]